MRVRKILIALIVTYLLIVSVLYLVHERIVFQPKQLATDHEFQFSHSFSEHFIEDSAIRLKINALHFPVADSAKGIVLYFHGNADNLQRWGEYTVDFTQHAYEVLAIDYPGYGKSPGMANEDAFYQSADLALQWAQERFALNQIIIYGRSLGSGPASWLATQHEVAQLILETPFPSISRLFQMRASKALVPFEPPTRFPVANYIQKVTYPITVFQGTDDWVVPYRVAIELKPFLKASDHFYTIEGGAHKNLRSFPEYHELLADLLR